MKLLVGLGNYPKEYEQTRHNVGFMFLDFLQKKYEGSVFSLKKDLEASLSEIHINQEKWILLKPHTYMNLSGRALGKAMDYYQIAPTDVWIVYDDIDMEFGKIRYRATGSSGGHNGIKSITQFLGGETFHRLKIGVSNEFRDKIPAADFVLQRFNEPEKENLPELFSTAEKVWKENSKI